MENPKNSALAEPPNGTPVEPKISAFVERIIKLPHFEYSKEVHDLANRHGDTPQLVQSVIAA